MRTFRIPRFSVTLEVALHRARIVARHDFRRAVEILRGARVALDSAIAIVARFFAASQTVVA